MAAPEATTRETPDGIPLRDGYQTLVTIAADTDISFWEVEVTPSEMDGGDPVEQTTQHNTTYNTKRPSSLIDHGPLTLTCAYDPDVRDEIAAVINTETTITVTYPDGSTDAFFGYVQKFTPDALVRGTQPRASVTIIQTNWDTADSVEAGPTLTEVAGT